MTTNITLMLSRCSVSLCLSVLVSQVSMLTYVYYHKAQNEAEADGRVTSSADILTENKVTGHINFLTC